MLREFNIAYPKEIYLPEHGIFTYEADLWFMVCVEARTICVFQPEICQKYIIDNMDKLSFESVIFDNQITAWGFHVCPEFIRGLKRYDRIPSKYWKCVNIQQPDNPSTKGLKAETLVDMLIYEGKLPYSKVAKKYTEAKDQYKGWDLLLKDNTKIQIKCDFYGDHTARYKSKTHSLFIQTHERNPKEYH